MSQHAAAKRILIATVMAATVVVPVIGQACASLLYKDAQCAAYAGRTMDHDADSDSIVIEFANGEQQVHDNPLGVMTNGPEFSWHLTNLNN